MRAVSSLARPFGAQRTFASSAVQFATEAALAPDFRQHIESLAHLPVPSSSRAPPLAPASVRAPKTAKQKGKQREDPQPRIAHEGSTHTFKQPPVFSRHDWRLLATSRSAQHAKLRPGRHVRRKRTETTKVEDDEELTAYIDRAKSLVELEQVAAKEMALEDVATRHWKDRQRSIRPIIGLVGRWKSPGEKKEGESDKAIAIFERTDPDSTLTEPLPALDYGRKAMVFIARDRGGGIDAAWPAQPAIARVRVCTPKRLEVEFEDAQVTMPADALFRVAYAWDDTVYRRQLQALDTLPTELGQGHQLDDVGVDLGRISRDSRPTEHVKIGTALRDAVLKPESVGLESNVFTDNQMIRSWAKRHLRSPAVRVEGDPELGLNASQTRAVAMAIDSRLSLIQGPPGTGKTMTIIAALRLLKLHFAVPQPILVCAPTHVAVDHLTAAAAEGSLKPLRLGRIERVTPSLRQYTMQEKMDQHSGAKLLATLKAERANFCSQLGVEDEDEILARSADSATMLEQPDDVQAGKSLKQRLQRIRMQIWSLERRTMADICDDSDIVLSTPLAAGTSSLDILDFPIVFLDEAAQCNETTSLVPLMKGSSHFVLIGDHKQLPSVCCSRAAAEDGFNVSLFERLMHSSAVPSVVLDVQYRMQADISHFPNEHFYGSQIVDAPLVNTRRQLANLANHPLLADRHVAFINHEGASQLEYKSYANYEEVEVVLSLVADLVKRLPKIRGHQIGIISPYARQTKLLEIGLADLAHGKRLDLLPWLEDRARAAGIQCATVDGFQGREKDVIILSTVRSKPKTGSRLGFLADPRRLCVALTRARHALFIVGNAHTLGGRGSAKQVEKSDKAIWTKLIDWVRSERLIWRWDDVKALLAV